ncbi:MAG: LacI family DNA-binding transcriptional regulator [Verrucomicrobiota bacterium]|nr:LacI family DNA-binding transcriptional regulator [Verrucomicrobiota bacterium]
MFIHTQSKEMEEAYSDLGIPTMAEIAARAGVSQVTVSRALRGDPRHSDATRARILALAKEMGYRPNPLVSALMAERRRRNPSRHTASLALINPYELSLENVNDNKKRFWKEALACAERQGFTLDEWQYRMTPADCVRVERRIRALGVAGVVLFHFPEAQMRLDMNFSDCATVAVGYSLAEPHTHRVSNQQVATITNAMDELHRRGYKRAGLATSITGEERVLRQWVAGWLGWEWWNKVKAPPEPYIIRSFSDESECDRFATWVKKEKVDVVVSTFAIGYDWLLKAGLRVPEDCGYAVLDTSPLYPQLSGMDQNWERIGASAIEVLAGQIYRNERGIPQDPTVTLVQSKWHEGETVINKRPIFRRFQPAKINHELKIPTHLKTATQ